MPGINKKLPPLGGPTVILSMVGGMLQVHGITEVILPPNGEPKGLEKDIAKTLKGIIKTTKTTIMIINFIL